MKQIVCEMCESTEFLKQDGMFVCQGCGMKYTAEDAKGLMVEVEGAPASGVANSAMANKVKYCAKLYKDGDLSGCKSACHEILMQDADNIEANILKIICDARTDNTICQTDPCDRYTERLVKAIEAAGKAYGSTQEYIDAVLPAAQFPITFRSTYEVFHKDRVNQAGGQGLGRLTILMEAVNYQLSALLNTEKISEAVLKPLNNPTEIASHLYRSVTFNYEWLEASLNPEKFDIPNRKFNKMAREYGEALQRIKKENYWKEHPEEKNKLLVQQSENKKQLRQEEEKKSTSRRELMAVEKEIDALEAKISNMKRSAEDPQTPAVLKADALKKEISSKSSTLAGLGLFKGKEKKALQAEIDDLNIKLTEEKAKAEAEQAERRAQIEKEISGHQTSLRSAQSKKSSLQSKINAAERAIERLLKAGKEIDAKLKG